MCWGSLEMKGLQAYVLGCSCLCAALEIERFIFLINVKCGRIPPFRSGKERKGWVLLGCGTSLHASSLLVFWFIPIINNSRQVFKSFSTPIINNEATSLQVFFYTYNKNNRPQVFKSFFSVPKVYARSFALLSINMPFMDSMGATKW